MTERIQQLRNYICGRKQKVFRRNAEWKLAESFQQQGFSPLERSAAAFEAVLKAETPAFIPRARLAFLRTVADLPELYTPAEQEAMRAEFSFCEKGVPFNFTPDFGSVINTGLPAFREKLLAAIDSADSEGREFLTASLRGLDALLDLLDRYIAAAEKEELTETAALLKAVRGRKPETFPEAIQLFRILHYALWCEGGYHIGAGRLDVTLYPYWQKDIESGRLAREEAFEYLEEFFLTFNIDSDLYVGVQQGDNGQSLMIGGCDRQGNEVWNSLSEDILAASCELKLIDPKINIRVNRNTPVERLALGSRLTRAGLGFPQYSNDDIMIPALEKWGYSTEDARDYSCAACWELVIPGKACEFVNLDAVSMPEVFMVTLNSAEDGTDFESFCRAFRSNLRKAAADIIERYKNIRVLPAPFISSLCPVSLEKGRNINGAGAYHNWGIHGTGFAVAADSFAALQKCVWQDKEFTLAEIKKVLADNFASAPDMQEKLQNAYPKLGGRDAEAAEAMLSSLICWWAEAWKGLRNSQGGIVRPGTGSAMYYIWHSSGLGATPDGRKAGEPFPANFSPSLDVPLAGPLSVIRSFSVPELMQAANGGPLTIELHDSVFSAPDGEMKTAFLIKDFIERGGHQLQLNTLNSETLRDAQKHPERYANLIVRVWGWSGRFVELDKVYQDHIIRRSELAFG